MKTSGTRSNYDRNIYRKETTRDERLRIVTLRDHLTEKGAPTPWKEIPKEMGVPWNTCRMINLRTKTQGSSSNRKRAGRPPAFQEKDIEKIIEYTIRDRNTRRMSWVDIRDNLGLSCSSRRIQDILASRGYHKRTPQCKWGIRERNRPKRVKLCQERLGWGYDEWLRTVWCDESYFSTAGFGSRPPVIRNAVEEYHPDCLDEVWESGSSRVMVWGAFCRQIKSDLVFVDGKVTLNSEVYTV